MILRDLRYFLSRHGQVSGGQSHTVVALWQSLASIFNYHINHTELKHLFNQRWGFLVLLWLPWWERSIEFVSHEPWFPGHLPSILCWWTCLCLVFSPSLHNGEELFGFQLVHMGTVRMNWKLPSSFMQNLKPSLSHCVFILIFMMDKDVVKLFICSFADIMLFWYWTLIFACLS